MGNNGFGDNFEGRHTFANSKQEVRTPLSKLIWGTMNIKAHMHICMHMHVHVHVLVCEKIHPWIHKMQFGFRRRRSIADDIAIVRRIAQIARKNTSSMCIHLQICVHIYMHYMFIILAFLFTHSLCPCHGSSPGLPRAGPLGG